MSLVLDLAIRHALWPVVFWTGALGLACLVAAIVTWQVMESMRPARVLSPAVKSLWYAWLVLALVVIPACSTMLFAAPFALERELAMLARTQPPLVVDWAASYGSKSLRQAVGVANDDVAMDISWVQQQLTSVDQVSAGSVSWAWRAVPRFLQAPYTRAAHRVLSSVGSTGSTITWRELDENVRALLTASTEIAAEGISLTLYAAAYRYLMFWWLTLAGCHLATLALRLAMAKTTRINELTS